MNRFRTTLLVRISVAAACLVSIAVVNPAAASAYEPVCGMSGDHEICISLPEDLPTTTGGTPILTGAVAVGVTNTPNSGKLVSTWLAEGTTGVVLMEQSGRSASNQGYSFTWPTHKYLDGTGQLRIRFNNFPAVSIDVVLENGNVGSLAPENLSPADWQDYLPGPWTEPVDPVVAAVGDGPDGSAPSSQVAASIAAADPSLVLFLGDIYEYGTYTENLNHYGVSSMDAPGAGTLWGAFADRTQPVIGNHELLPDWTDYFHQRPTYTSYTHGGALFLALDSRRDNLLAGSAQYEWVQQQLQSAPACTIAYFHHPVLNNGGVNPKIVAMWQLLASSGVDVVLNGHAHFMAEYVPLDANLQPGADAHTVQLISGAGGHEVSPTQPDSQTPSRIAWASTRGTIGAAYLTLVGAANDGTATRIAWEYRNAKTVANPILRTGSVDCEGGSTAPVVSSFTPDSGETGDTVTLTGSAFLGATSVTFGAVPVAQGNFDVVSDTQITASVPPNAVSGPICVTVDGQTGCSTGSFTVETVPSGDAAYVRQIGTAANTTGAVLNQLSVTVGPGGIPAGDSVILSVAAQGAVSVTGATDSRGNLYALDVVRAYGGTAPCTAAILSGRLTTSLVEGDTIKVTVSSGRAWGFVADQWSGLAASVGTTGSQDSAGVKTTEITATTSGDTTDTETAVIGATCAGGEAISPGPGFALSGDVTLSYRTVTKKLASEYRTVDVAGVQTATFTQSPPRNWAAVVATYPAGEADPPSGGAAYLSQIGSVTNQSGVPQQTLSVQVGPTGVAAGETIIISVAAQRAVSVLGATDDAGNVYVVDATRAFAAAVPCTAALISTRVMNALAPGQTISVTVSDGRAWGFAADRWQGLTGEPLLDVSGSADSAAGKTSIVTATTSAATSQTPEAVVSVACVGTTGSITAGPGYTRTADILLQFGTVTRRLGAEYAIATDVATKTATFALGTASHWSAVIAAYR